MAASMKPSPPSSPPPPGPPVFVVCDICMFAVIHDWGDDDCVRILSNVREAMPPGGRITVVEGHVREGPGPDFIKATDMLMLAYGTGGGILAGMGLRETRCSSLTTWEAVRVAIHK